MGIRRYCSARLLVLLVSICFVATLSSAGPATSDVAAPASGYGFSVGAAWDGKSMDGINRELDAVSKTGASWIRILIDWNQIEPAKGEFNWSKLDAIVEAAISHNLKPLGLIAYTAQWARSPGSFFTALPVKPSDFAGFAVTVVSRYADRIAHWQLWNEPNLPLFSGLVPITGAHYAELLKATYPAIKAVQPGSIVLAAAMSRTLGDSSPPAFVEQIYAAGAKGMFDAAAAHPYVFPEGLAADPENGWSDIGRIHDVMASHGDGDKKVWLTELGAPTNDPSAGGVSQQEQSDQISTVLAAAATLSYIGPAFIYSIRDIDTTDRSNRESNFGALLTTDWQPKVAASVLARTP